jgi:hypothetical protein
MTGYFASFPLTYMQTPDGGNVIIRDFFRRVDVASMFGDVSVGLIPYTIPMGGTPESVANTFYASPYYHWVIILVNGIVDLYEEWPLSQTALNAKIADAYDSPDDVHHYVNADDYTVDSTAVGATPVTNVEYETALNDAKRSIRVLDPQYLSPFVTQFNTLIGD